MSQKYPFGKKRAFIEALIEHGTISAAARIAGVTRKTGQRWLRDPELRLSLGQAGGVVYAALAAKATGLASEALDTLASEMRAKKVVKGANSRIRAALGVLDSATRLRESVCLEERIMALEQQSDA